MCSSCRLLALGIISRHQRAITATRRDVRDRGPATLTITVGDYIDRGPQSRGVHDRLIENPFPTLYVALKGQPTKLCSRLS